VVTLVVYRCHHLQADDAVRNLAELVQVHELAEVVVVVLQVEVAVDIELVRDDGNDLRDGTHADTHLVLAFKELRRVLKTDR
jgi:hypothetical protein